MITNEMVAAKRLPRRIGLWTAVGVLVGSTMLGNSLIEEPLTTGRDFLIILIGIPVYLFWKGKRAAGNE